jgi:hypothetical protein
LTLLFLGRRLREGGELLDVQSNFYGTSIAVCEENNRLLSSHHTAFLQNKRQCETILCDIQVPFKPFTLFAMDNQLSVCATIITGFLRHELITKYEAKTCVPALAQHLWLRI